MSSLASFGVRKPVVANLVMLAIIALGLIFGLSLRREFFPQIDPVLVNIVAPYPGAAPDEVERSLAVKIEDSIEDLDDVKEVTSVVREGLASITVEFREGVDIDVKVAEVKREVDALQDLPDAADRIVVDKFEPNLPVIVLSIFGDGDERGMKDAIRSVRDDLRTLPGMGDVALSGVRVDEVRVEVRPEASLQHNLSLPRISQTVREHMVELPSGSVKGASQNVAVRTLAADERAETIREIVIKSDPSGQVLRLGDVADVRDGFADVEIRERLNGKPSVSLTVFKVGDEDAVSMAAMVKAYVAGLKRETIDLTLRERIAGLVRPPNDTSPVSDRVLAYELGLSRVAPLPGEIALTTDLARFIVGRLELLSRNACWGLALVFLTLVVLLNWRVSFWVAAGLAVSLTGTLAAMALLGVTLNLLTMFGLIIVLGLLVDDAIVVAENIIARHEAGEPALQAAVSGTGQVNWPVVATVLTTIGAFMPLALVQGDLGNLLEVLPQVVAIALAVSLIEALFILPCHMGHSLLKVDRLREAGRQSRFERLESKFDGYRDALFRRILVPRYAWFLERALKHRYLTVVGAIALMVASFGLVAGEVVRFTFFDSSDAETVNGELIMPIGTPAAETDRILRRVEAAAINQPEVSAAFASVGRLSALDGASSSEQSHLGQVILELKPVEERERRSKDVILAIQQELGEIPGVKSFRMEEVAGGPGGPALSLTVIGDETGPMLRAVQNLENTLAEFESVYGIANDSDAGQRELQIELKPGAAELGFTVANLGQQVRASVFGLEAYTFAGDREDVDVRVTMPADVRTSLSRIEELYVFTPLGVAVPLREVAELTERDGYATVRRLDGQRAITVTAEVDDTINNAEQVARAIRPKLGDVVAGIPGVRIAERGRQQDMRESFSTLPLGMAVAFGAIYVVLVWLFSSYVQPLVVMSAIPFATIGMIWGHLLLGFDLTFLSIIGFIALAGVVVNDSLIFIEFYNERRREGANVHDSAMAAGRARLRAILLTTITTVLGLSPLMLEQSFQARFLIPMAITIACGLISATFIILIVLPCLLMIAADIGRVMRALWSGRWDPSDRKIGGVDLAMRSPRD